MGFWRVAEVRPGWCSACLRDLSVDGSVACTVDVIVSPLTL